MVGYILLSHGSKVKESNDASAEILAELRKSIKYIELAFLELAKPSFEEAVQNLKNSGVTSIKVLPLFLAPGKHVKEDVPHLKDEFSIKYEVEIAVLDYIGSNSGYIKLIETILLDK
jgi:sirohydrochlorin cobaltochelatase